MKYSLRSLMIVVLVGPPLVGGCYWCVRLYPSIGMLLIVLVAALFAGWVFGMFTSPIKL